MLSNFFLAMAWAREGDPAQARSAFDAGVRQWEASAPRPGSDDLEHFEDWVLCKLAWDEAVRALAEGGAPVSHVSR